MDLALHLACEGSFRNSGQRCTAVKRILVHKSLVESFTEAFVKKAETYRSGDPASMDTRVGTVIDEASAKRLESSVREAVEQGAKVLLGGNRNGALLEPTVISNVPRDAKMITSESFGPLAPILAVDDIEIVKTITEFEMHNGRDYHKTIQGMDFLQTFLTLIGRLIVLLII